MNDLSVLQNPFLIGDQINYVQYFEIKLYMIGVDVIYFDYLDEILI